MLIHFIKQKLGVGQKSSGRQLPGSALLLTMFILSGILIVGLSGSYVIMLGIKAGATQSNSVRSYFTAEAGAEQLLWELRKNEYAYGSPSEDPIFSGNLLDYDANYEVFLDSFPPLVFSSVGEYLNTKRSVEIKFGE